jgi:hypothetical protein
VFSFSKNREKVESLKVCKVESFGEGAKLADEMKKGIPFGFP